MYLRKKRVRSTENQTLLEHIQDIQINGLPETKHISYALPCMHTPFIGYGYRVDYSFSQCLLSIFSIHNETMNIWSHLIGFLCTLFAGISILVEYQAKEIPLLARVATASYIVGACCCLLFSTVYHVFGCMSDVYQQYLLILDMGGVAMLTGGSLFVWIAYGFYCTPVLCAVYLTFTGLIVIGGIFIAVLGSYNTDFAYYTRVLGYLVIGILCIIPCTHWYYITPWEIKKELLLGLVGTLGSYALGLFFYVARMPEALFPNSFFATHIAPSHTLWHLMVCCAVAILLRQAMAYQDLVAHQVCPTTLQDSLE